MFNNFAKFDLPAIKGNELWPETIQSPLIVRPSLTYVPNEHEPPRAEAFTKHFQDIVDAKSPQILNFLMTQRRNYQLGSVEFASTVRQADPLTMHYTNIQGKHEILGLNGTITPAKYQAMQAAPQLGSRLIGRLMQGAPYIQRKSYGTSSRRFNKNGTAIRMVIVNINKVTDDNFNFSINGEQVIVLNFAPQQQQTGYVIEAGNLKNAPPVEQQGPWSEIVVAGTKRYETIKDSPFTLDPQEDNSYRGDNIASNGAGNFFIISAFLFDPAGNIVSTYNDSVSRGDGESFSGYFNLAATETPSNTAPSVINYASGSRTISIPGPSFMIWSLEDYMPGAVAPAPPMEGVAPASPPMSGDFSVSVMPDK